MLIWRGRNFKELGTGVSGLESKFPVGARTRILILDVWRCGNPACDGEEGSPRPAQAGWLDEEVVT
jgi:hypothetical protein